MNCLPSERRLIISEAKVNGTSVSYDRFAHELLIISLLEPLAPESVKIELGFKGSLYALPPQANKNEVKLEELLKTFMHQHEREEGMVSSVKEMVSSVWRFGTQSLSLMMARLGHYSK